MDRNVHGNTKIKWENPNIHYLGKGINCRITCQLTVYMHKTELTAATHSTDKCQRDNAERKQQVVESCVSYNLKQT